RDAVARARIGAVGDERLADGGVAEPGGRADGELLPAVLPLPGRRRGLDVGGADPAAVAVVALDHDPAAVALNHVEAVPLAEAAERVRVGVRLLAEIDRGDLHHHHLALRLVVVLLVEVTLVVELLLIEALLDELILHDLVVAPHLARLRPLALEGGAASLAARPVVPIAVVVLDQLLLGGVRADAIGGGLAARAAPGGAPLDERPPPLGAGRPLDQLDGADVGARDPAGPSVDPDLVPAVLGLQDDHLLAGADPGDHARLLARGREHVGRPLRLDLLV